MDGIELIEKLNVTEEAKEVLRKVNRVASSSNPVVKASIKNLFVTCPYGAALSDYARVYEKIIVENAVYRVVGKGTYLELAFPKMGTEKDYAEFYMNILRWRSHPISWNRAMESVIESHSSDGGSHDPCRGSQ